MVQGTVEVAFVADDGTEVEAILTEGNGIEFEPETCALTVPETNVGDVVGDLGRRRTTIEAVEPAAGIHRISGLVPLAEMFAYTTALRSMTSGRGGISRGREGCPRIG